MTNADFDPATAVLEDIAGAYTLDPAHSRLGFSARHAMVATVRGQFTEFTGTAHVDTASPANSKVEVSIVANSISTGNEQRDGHLKSADFLDVEQYPTITFRSTSAEEVDSETYKMVGDLTIKDQTHPVTLELDFQGSSPDPFGNTRAGFEGKTTVNRKDWGLTWNVAIEGGGILVGEKVKLELDVSAIKRVTPDAE
jgi:polyisoprenoid-binding protein YceI